MLALEVREELSVGIRTVLRPFQHQPGGPACGQRRSLQLDDAWERLARAPLAWPSSLGLAQTLHVAGHRGIAPGTAAALEVPKEP